MKGKKEEKEKGEKRGIRGGKRRGALGTCICHKEWTGTCRGHHRLSAVAR